MKKIMALLLAGLLLAGCVWADYTLDESVIDGAEVDESVFLPGEIAVTAAALELPAPEAILMEKETGTVLYEKNADQPRQPASVTKVITLLLIAEAVDSGRLSLTDTVTVSETAERMGGSQVYLEQGEQMTVDEMLKCIVVSSANDAAVAMAEHLAGSEEAFAEKMNERAAALGLEHTHFTNCTGLANDSTHVTTAREIAVMSRELMRHAWIRQYTTIWSDSIRGGEFGLNNTNKLIRYFDGATGLKTGFTQEAMYCLSATAERDGVEYIAVVMGCDSSQNRFKSAATLLSFAFANYTLASAAPEVSPEPVPVRLGTEAWVTPELTGDMSLLVRRDQCDRLERTVELVPELTAPVRKGDVIGSVTVTDGENVLAKLDLCAGQDVERLTWGQIVKNLLWTILGCEQSVKTVDKPAAGC